MRESNLFIKVSLASFSVLSINATKGEIVDLNGGHILLFVWCSLCFPQLSSRQNVIKSVSRIYAACRWRAFVELQLLSHLSILRNVLFLISLVYPTTSMMMSHDRFLSLSEALGLHHVIAFNSILNIWIVKVTSAIIWLNDRVARVRLREYIFPLR